MARAVALGVAVVLLAALPGEAQVLSMPSQTPRGGSVELRFGLYRPQLDSEQGLSGTPFTDVFGGSSWLLGEAEFQRFFYQGVGSAGLSLSVGYAEKYGNALLDDGSKSVERQGFHVVPLHLRGVYRFDYPAFHWSFPLIPYIKPGLVYIPWWTNKGDKTETTTTNKGSGGKLGWEVAGGVSFLLDVLEPRFARDFDSDLGINHSYVFAEYTYSKVNNFGGQGLNLSDSYWM